MMNSQLDLNKGKWLEKYIERIFKENGFYIHFFERNSAGQQPCDFIAIKGDRVMFFDTKHCSSDYFSVNRIEVNQYLSFQMLIEKTNAEIGFLVYFEKTKSIKILEFCRVFGEKTKKTYKENELEDLIL